LLATKVQPPRIRGQTIWRERLLRSVGPEPGVKLTAVTAPAGSGKTTLLGTWREREAEHRPVAWLSLDGGDDDPVVLWAYIREALREAEAVLEISLKPELVGVPGLTGVWLPQVIGELARQGDLALVLDDFHRLSNGPARDSVALLVDRAPPSFHVVISSRSEPGLPIARWRAHGELQEIRANQLAFSPDEADALMNGQLDLAVSFDEVRGLVDRTEGWPAGLYLAALSLQGATDRRAFLRAFSGSSRYVVDFLMDEVLQTHDPEEQVLLLRSSTLDRFCGPLCDAVLETQGSGAVLDSISRKNLFLIPLDDVGQWYRFHHLFGQLLRVELEHRDPGLAPTLHRRAHGWYRERGLSDEAIEHALRGEAFGEAGELVLANWAHYANASRYATVLNWLGRFPHDVVQQDARLLMVQAWVQSMCADRDAAAASIAALEGRGGLDDGPLPDGFDSLEASLATLKATIPWGDVASGYENASRAAELLGPDSPFRSLACWGLGMGHYLRGELEEADRWLAEAASLAPLGEMWIIAASALAYRSLVVGELGRLGDQAALAEAGTALARQQGVEEIDGEVPVALGASRLAQGVADEAVPLLERGVSVLRAWGQPIDLANALIWLTTALRAIGDREAAAASIAEARAIVDSCPDPGILRDRVEALEQAPPRGALGQSDDLSERELAVLRLLRSALSEREIGRELHLSHNTVHSHTRAIYRKLHVSTRAEAVKRARALHLG
jgi:LuxR family maltose regulon positive regulatory protein